MGRFFIIVGKDERANNHVGTALLDKEIRQEKKSYFKSDNVTILYDLTNKALMEDAAGRADTHVLLVVTGDKLQDYIDFMTEFKDLQKKIKLVIFNRTEQIREFPQMKKLMTMCDECCIDVDEGMTFTATKKLIEDAVSAKHGWNQSTEQKPQKMRRPSSKGKRLHVPVHVAIIGGPGTGKSSLGNLLLQEDAFNADMYKSTFVKQISIKQKDKLTVYDVPNSDEKKNYKEIKTRLTSQGEKVVLIFTLKFGTRMTKEETSRIENLKKTFGEEYLSHHLCLAMTFGDEFEVIQRQGQIKDFHSYMEASEFSGSCSLFRLCQGRYCLVNNLAETDEAEDQYCQNVMDVINTVV